MKTTIVTLVLMLTLSPSLMAQDDLQVRYAEKLQQPFVEHVDWVHSFEAAKKTAAQEEKLIVAYFTRSYVPCPSCIQLEGVQLVSGWWKSLSAEFVPYLNITTRIESTPDQELLLEMGRRKFPSVFILNAEGERLASFRPTSEATVRIAISRARIKQDLLSRSPRDEATEAGLTLLEVMGTYSRTDLENLDKLAATKDLDERILRIYPSLRVELTWVKVFEEAKEGLARPENEGEAIRELSKALYPKVKEMGEPKGIAREIILRMILVEAVAQRDLKVVKMALPIVEATLSTVSEQNRAAASADLGYIAARAFIAESEGKTQGPAEHTESPLEVDASVPASGITSSTPLEEAVAAFNQLSLTRHIGKNQPRLTPEAVVAAIRWNLLPAAKLKVSDGTCDALRKVTLTGILPDSFRLEALTTFEPDTTTVFTIWSVRLRIPTGEPNSYGSTTCISIHETMVNSRVMGPAEQAVVKEQQKIMTFSSWQAQSFLEKRQQAIETDRKK